MEQRLQLKLKGNTSANLHFSGTEFQSVLVGNLVSSRYPRQVLNNQSDRGSLVKLASQKSVAFLPVVTTRIVKAYLFTGRC